LKSVFIDTSALAAILFNEPGSAELREILEGLKSVHAANLLEAELRSAAARENQDPDAVNDALSFVQWVSPGRVLSSELKAVADCGIHLKGADSWHLACALYLAKNPSAIPFMTLDRDQAEAAARLGFQVLPSTLSIGSAAQEPPAPYNVKKLKTKSKTKVNK
jgi:predicted nucleic acid-binding protein